MTTLSKDEVVEMAREAGFSQDWQFAVPPATLSSFATLCRAPLVAEVERLKQAHEINADTLNAMQVEIDDWKARALKSEQAGEPVLWQYRWTNPSGNPCRESRTGWKPVELAWNQTVQQKCDELLAYRFEGKPTYEVRALYTQPQPAAQKPTSAVPVVKQLVEALEGVVVGADESWTQACKELNSMGITSVPVSNASAGLINRQIEAIDVARTAIAAGQKFIKENGK